MKHCGLMVVVLLASLVGGCSTGSERGIADKRSDFKRFMAMEGDAARYGLRTVRPYFKTANRAEILRAIQTACTNGKEGSSEYNPSTQAGYYVNCNPRNRQLLNGYIAANARKRPHSSNGE